VTEPLYRKIHTELREKIVKGEYPPGAKLPSEKELCQQYDTSRITSRRVMEMLADEGLIVRQPGRGSFVADPLPEDGQSSSSQVNDKKLIGFVITDFSASFGTELISGAERTTTSHGAFLVLRRSFGVPEKEEKAIEELLQLGVDGLLILPAQAEHFSTKILQLVIDRFPLVLVDRDLKGIAATSVRTDNVAGALCGVRYLLEHGHRHIGLASPPPMESTTIEDRINGFVQAHAEAGVAFDQEHWLQVTSTLPGSFYDDNIESDVESIKAHFEKHPELTAVFAIEYNIALLVAEAAKRLGLRIPEDLSIVCFDSPDVGIEDHRFTHLLQDQEGMGRFAVESLLAMIRGDDAPKKVLLDAKLVEGLSTKSPSMVHS